MSLLSGTKSLWRRSIKVKDQDTSHDSNSTLEPITLAVIGCGSRGNAYAVYPLSCPDKCKIVAIAEPRPNTRKSFADTHKVDRTLVFNTWQELHAASAETISTIGTRLADAVIIAVQDHMHADVALAFAEQGYQCILCEKPMATSLEDCIKMEAALKKSGTIFGMGHVMRYSPYNKGITDIVRSGSLGELVNVVHVEPVGYWHFAHSFVRGNWSKEQDSSFVLMTKSCHDIDILCHWMSPAKPVRVSSFGSLRHFRRSEKPAAAGNAIKCLDCPAEQECPYSAKKIYLDRVAHGHVEWPVSILIDGVPDIENITHALHNGPYGKCVYESENDVCDHQVVNLEFSNGSTASFTLVAYTSLICTRQTRMHFTHGEIVGDDSKYTVTDFRKNKLTVYHPKAEGGGHGGGDLGLIRAFVEAVKTGRQEVLGTDVTEVLKSHLTVFAAEHSRRTGQVVDCVEFEKLARQRVELEQVVGT